MDLTIKETGETATLSILGPDGVDFTVELIRNTGALSDGQFDFDEESDTWVCSQDTYDRWAKVISDNELLDARLPGLNKKHGTKTVNQSIRTAGNCDLKDLARNINSALNRSFGKQ